MICLSEPDDDHDPCSPRCTVHYANNCANPINFFKKSHPGIAATAKALGIHKQTFVYLRERLGKENTFELVSSQGMMWAGKQKEPIPYKVGARCQGTPTFGSIKAKKCGHPAAAVDLASDNDHSSAKSQGRSAQTIWHQQMDGRHVHDGPIPRLKQGVWIAMQHVGPPSIYNNKLILILDAIQMEYFAYTKESYYRWEYTRCITAFLKQDGKHWRPKEDRFKVNQLRIDEAFDVKKKMLIKDF